MEAAHASSSKGKERAIDTDEDAEEDGQDLTDADVKPFFARPASPRKPDSRLPFDQDTVDLLKAHGNILRSVLRKHIKETMIGIKDFAMLPQKCPPLTDEEIEAYRLNQPDAPVVDPRDLRIDFEHPWKQFSYNQEVAHVIVDDFLTTMKAPGGPSLAVPKALLSKAVIHYILDSHMKTLRGTYAEYRKGPLQVVNALRRKKQNKNGVRGRRQSVSVVRPPHLQNMLISSLDILLARPRFGQTARVEAYPCAPGPDGAMQYERGRDLRPGPPSCIHLTTRRMAKSSPQTVSPQVR